MATETITTEDRWAKVKADAEASRYLTTKNCVGEEAPEDATNLVKGAWHDAVALQICINSGWLSPAMWDLVADRVEVLCYVYELDREQVIYGSPTHNAE